MIDLNSVTKIYDDGNVGIQDVNIHVREGEFVFIVGASGAGKSTLIRLLMKELDPDEGTIVIDGQDITDLSHRDIALYRRKIGIVFQDNKLLLNKKVGENVALALEVVHAPKRTIERNVKDVLDVMGILDKIDKFPHELSVGQQQRVAIARAIVNKPKILIADEPTGSLDPATKMEIMQFLSMVNTKLDTTVLMVTHDKDIVNAMKKRVISIQGGHVVSDHENGGYV